MVVSDCWPASKLPSTRGASQSDEARGELYEAQATPSSLSLRHTYIHKRETTAHPSLPFLRARSVTSGFLMRITYYSSPHSSDSITKATSNPIVPTSATITALTSNARSSHVPRDEWASCPPTPSSSREISLHPSVRRAASGPG